MIETVISEDGTEIAYERTGRGPALILATGALNSRVSARDLAVRLADDFSVFTYDRRGRGDSGDTAPYSVDREVQDLRAILYAAGGVAHLYGHSSGGILALLAAVDTPGFSKVAVYEPPFATDQKPGFAEHIEQLVRDGRGDDALADWMRNTGAPFEEGWRHAPFWSGLVALAHTLPYDLALTGDGSVPTALFGGIHVDTLALYGGDSDGWARESTTAVAAAIDGARTAVVPGQGHPVAHDVIAPILVDFFL